MKTLLMAPTRKSRSVKKRYKDYAEISPEKDVGTSNKCQPQKRKLSDMLGSQWSKDELERFYEAYRKYGKDWKKVASVVCNRTVEMVEALYNMNRAYLSLPEGTASVAGLIAMMTDHYNVLEGSGSDRESNDASKVHPQPKKRSRGKVQLSGLKGDLLQSPPVASNDGCLSLLRRRSDGCTVRKRTPRIPVSYSSRKDSSENYISSSKRGRKMEADENVAHVAALALTEASQISESPYRTGHVNSSPLKSQGKMSELLRTKLRGTLMDEDYFEGSFGSRGAWNGIYARHGSSVMDEEGVGTIEVYRKGRKINEKREKIENIRIDPFDDGREACTGTGEAISLSNVGGKVDTEVANENSERSSLGKRKRNKKLFFGDDSSELEALQTLADLSLTMPASKVESEPLMPLKEDRPTDLTDRPIVLQADSTSRQRNKNNTLAIRENVLHTFSGVDTCTSEQNQLGRESRAHFKALSERKQQEQSANKSGKRKCNSSSFKKSRVRYDAGSGVNKPLKTGAFTEEEENLVNKVICASQEFSPSKQSKSVGDGEYSSTNSDTIRKEADSAVSTALSPTSGDAGLPAKRRSRRKMDLKIISIRNEMKLPEFISKERLDKLSTVQDGSLYLKDKVSCCLSSYKVRRWCTFEWFYSAIDYPWFAKGEFVEYLNHVGLGHIPRLTHVEWGVIRSSLGKPRRFSENFLCEEMEKLKQYRQSVREHYTELRTGVKEGLPTDLAPPLSVGQRVIVIHPKSREVHDGSVLTVDYDKCRIRFDRPELGVEIVTDIDCMPSDTLGNMPEATRRQHSAVARSFVNSRGLGPRQSAVGGSMVHVPTELLGNVQSSAETSLAQGKGDTTCATPAKAANIVNAQYAAYSQPFSVAQIHARETDIHALSELTRALDKKEAKLMELKLVNDNLLKNKDNGDSSIKRSENFKQQYAMVSSALLNLRQRNTYPANSLPPWLKSPASSSGLVGPIKSLDNSSVNNQELGSSVVVTVNNSKLEAQAMVHTAIQAMSKLKMGQNAFANVVEALDSLGRCKSPPDYGSSIIRSSEQVNVGLAYKSQLKLKTDPLLNGHASDPKQRRESDGMGAQIPSELIASCVATWLMIQMCTERQYPPADVAQILDSAVTSLHPRCSQNLPIYREIQMCMGRVKTQILALVPM